MAIKSIKAENYVMRKETKKVDSFVDIIGDISSWTPDCLVVIKAATGMGKSSFIMNDLYEYAKEHDQKILLLVHRKNCKKQFELDLDKAEKTENIKISTYQLIQNCEITKEPFDMSEYHYIVSDEFHYFISDSKYNTETDISYDSILKQEHAVRIFMSATADNMEFYLKWYSKKRMLIYELPQPESMITEVDFITKKEPADAIADMAIKEKVKAILFMRSVSEAYTLYQKYRKNAVFCCSKQNAHYGRFTDNKKISKILEDKSFDKNLLITTSCMDSGITLKDPEIKVIYTDIDDPQVVVQCIGRKRRVSDEDTVTIVMPYRDRKWLARKKFRENEAVEQAKFLNREGTASYVEKYTRRMQKNGMIYAKPSDSGLEFVVNSLMYEKYMDDINTLNKLLEQENDYAYCRYMTDLLKPGCNAEYSFLEDDRWDDYLRSHVGKEYKTPKEKEELIKGVAFNKRTARKINEILRKKGSEYGIKEYRSCKRNKKTKYRPATKSNLRCWKIVQMVELPDAEEKSPQTKQKANVVPSAAEILKNEGIVDFSLAIGKTSHNGENMTEDNKVTQDGVNIENEEKSPETKLQDSGMLSAAEILKNDGMVDFTLKIGKTSNKSGNPTEDNNVG